MQCHYDVLGVDQKADSEQIKKAFRKKALQWHPDKNLDRVDEAQEQFRLARAAYEILIDPQDRAWYDKHRDLILDRGNFKDYEDKTLDLLAYFTSTAYKGFGNDCKSFYSVYGEVFRKISEEDMKFCDERGIDDAILPEFGDGDSDYDEVVHLFYSTWQAYSTKLSYVWIEKYNVMDAPDRRTARLIEKENKRDRDKERKKRNELVRDLVNFVRKRDPRHQAHKEALELKAQEQIEKAAARRAEILRNRLEEAALYEEKFYEENLEHDEKVAQLEQMMKEEFGFSSDDSQTGKEDETDEEPDDRLYCAACNKRFKTLKALENHEKSKKHKENVKKLQLEMKDEINREVSDVDDLPPHNDDFGKRKCTTKLTKRQKKQRKQRKIFGEISDDGEGEEVVEASDDFQHSSTSVQDSNPPIPDKSTVDLVSNEKPSCSDDLKFGNPKQARKKKSKKKQTSNQNLKQTQTASSNIKNSTSDLPEPSIICATCRDEYSSRNKLFQHIESSGHGLPLENITKSRKIKR